MRASDSSFRNALLCWHFYIRRCVQIRAVLNTKQSTINADALNNLYVERCVHCSVWRTLPYIGAIAFLLDFRTTISAPQTVHYQVSNCLQHNVRYATASHIVVKSTGRGMINCCLHAGVIRRSQCSLETDDSINHFAVVAMDTANQQYISVLCTNHVNPHSMNANANNEKTNIFHSNTRPRLARSYALRGMKTRSAAFPTCRVPTNRQNTLFTQAITVLW